jgi:Protein of unknown function (DUF2934)
MATVTKISKSPRKKTVRQSKVTEVTLEARHRMIAEAAYYKAAERNFATGDPKSDWLKAEVEIDANLDKKQGNKVSA